MTVVERVREVVTEMNSEIRSLKKKVKTEKRSLGEFEDELSNRTVFDDNDDDEEGRDLLNRIQVTRRKSRISILKSSIHILEKQIIDVGVLVLRHRVSEGN